MKRIYLLTPLDVPDDTDMPQLRDAFNEHLNGGREALLQQSDWVPDSLFVRSQALDSYPAGSSLSDLFAT